MKQYVKITLLLCLSLVLMFGSAMADMGNNSTQDTPSADTPSNNSVNGTDDVDDAAADGNETDDTGDVDDGAAAGNETDDTGDVDDDAAAGNETDDAGDVDNNVTDELTDELFSEGEEVDDETDDIPPFEGAVGPEHALYGLKIAFGNINETFTYNSSERLGLQVSRARHRIAEARAETEKGNDNAAGIALGHYKKMMDNIDSTVNGSDISDEDVVRAKEKISKHQKSLEYMIQQKEAQGKNVKGLTNALNNSLRLEEKFELKRANKGQADVGQELVGNTSDAGDSTSDVGDSTSDVGDGKSKNIRPPKPDKGNAIK